MVHAEKNFSPQRAKRRSPAEASEDPRILKNSRS